MMFSRYICSISRSFSCSVVKPISSFLPFRHNFSKDDEKKILDAVNKCNVDELTKFNLSKARAQKIFLYKSKHGSFKEIQQMLELDGFGEKVLHKFCISIVDDSKETEETKTNLTSIPNLTRKINQYCYPRLDDLTRSQIKSCLGVHVHSGSISWAKLTLNKDNPMSLDTWSDYKFDEKKLHLADLATLTKKICEQMPIADVYVLEAPISAQPSLPGQNIVQMTVNIQKSQLIGMTALGLLYKEQETVNPRFREQLFFVRNFLPARLFRTKVGTERVSAENIVLDILRYHYNVEDETGGSQDGSLSGQVNASNKVRQIFDKAEPCQRDLMAQAFLTALTFVRLCVQKCHKSLEKLEKRSN